MARHYGGHWNAVEDAINDLISEQKAGSSPMAGLPAIQIVGLIAEHLKWGDEEDSGGTRAKDTLKQIQESISARYQGRSAFQVWCSASDSSAVKSFIETNAYKLGLKQKQTVVYPDGNAPTIVVNPEQKAGSTVAKNTSKKPEVSKAEAIRKTWASMGLESKAVDVIKAVEKLGYAKVSSAEVSTARSKLQKASGGNGATPVDAPVEAPALSGLVAPAPLSATGGSYIGKLVEAGKLADARAILNFLEYGQ